jgi:hypothetical protein
MGGLFIGLMICIILSPTAPAIALVAVLIVLVFIAVPIITSRLERNANADFYDEKISGYRAALEVDPRNLGARGKLMDTYYTLGMLDEAIAEGEEILRLMPDDRQVAYRVRLMKEDREEKICPPRTCPSCGHRNPGRRTRCENCERTLSVASEFKQWLVEGGLKKLTLSSALSIGIIALIAAGLSLLSVPGKIAFIALALIIVISAEYAYITRQW